jgi:hypothetical protein
MLRRLTQDGWNFSGGCRSRFVPEEFCRWRRETRYAKSRTAERQIPHLQMQILRFGSREFPQTKVKINALYKQMQEFPLWNNACLDR